MLDTSRHQQVFDADWVPGTILVVGLGSIGSNVAYNLAKLNLTRLTLLDDDVVELHNLANQRFDVGDVGLLKVYSVNHAIGAATGVGATVVAYRLGDEKADVLVADLARCRYNTVVLCTDSIESRRLAITRIRLNRVTSLVVDCRMNATQANVYAFDPRDFDQLARYEATLHADDEVDDRNGGCTLTQSIGATAQVAADLATWQLIHWARDRKEGRTGADRAGAFEVICDLQRFRMMRQPV